MSLSKPLPFDVKKHDNFVRLQGIIGDIGGLQKFEVGDYEFIDDEGRRGLLVQAHPKKVGPSYLSFGLRFGYSSAEQTDFGLLLSYRKAEMNRLGGEWETYLSLGDSTRVASEWYQPVDFGSSAFLRGEWRFRQRLHRGARCRWRSAALPPANARQAGWMSARDCGRRVKCGLATRVAPGRISRRLGVAEEVPTKVSRGWLHADLLVDTLDDASFANARHVWASVAGVFARRARCYR
jgi:NTE family protein